MNERPIFDPNHPGDWPTDEDGEPLSQDEVTVALYELVKKKLIEITFDERNRVWVRATPDGHAAYAIEEAFGFPDEDPFSSDES